MDIGVLTIVTLVLLGFATRATQRAIRRRHWEGAQGRAVWAAILIVAVATALFFEIGHHRQRALATSAMAAVTDNNHARADCQRFTEALFSLGTYDGYVYQANSNVAMYEFSPRSWR